MKNLAALLFVLLTSSLYAQQDQKIDGKWAFYGEEFYGALTAKRKIDRPLLHKILNETHSSTSGKFDAIAPQCIRGAKECYKHTSVGYDTARKIMFGELDMLKDENGMYVLDVYCGKKFYFSTVEEVSKMGNIVNIEHTWPQSKFTGAFPKDMQKSDMHHLYPTDSHANSTRGNSPFGLLKMNEDRTGGEGCRASRYGIINYQEVYTPPASHRGNVARAIFYFSMHYNLGIDKAQETSLRKWHKEDPIDEKEIKRHEGVAKYQKVRNPFVDHPELVDSVTDF